MIFVHCHFYRCSPRLVGFATTKIVSGDTKALDLGGTWVSLIKTNVDLSLQKIHGHVHAYIQGVSIDLSMDISMGVSMDASMAISLDILTKLTMGLSTS